MMTPLHFYLNQCKNGLIIKDEQQIEVLRTLDNIHHELQSELKNRNGFLKSWRNKRLISGLYLWGGVGVGKTLLMDAFFQCLPFQQKLRMHFYQFMQLIHTELKKHQGQTDPLKIIAKNIAKNTIVLCFDEFIVTDILDAMLLNQLFKELFLQGVCLVTTSNVAPEDLYKNGLQRSQFIPVIHLLKKHTTIINILSTDDYRLGHVQHTVTLVDNEMEKTFSALTTGISIKKDPISICNRLIPIRKTADNIIWFDFDVICAKPRNQQDYLAIAKMYKTIFISNIPVISPNNKNTIVLFIRLIDILYDARVKLIFSSDTAVEKIYRDGPMSFEYTRTCSRLLEMQADNTLLRSANF